MVTNQNDQESRLRARSPGSTAPTGAPHRHGPTLVKRRVLVVEDEQVFRDAIGPLLEDEGFDVSFAVNGREALSRLHVDSPVPDVIMLDLRMPVMDGWQFRAIQKDDPKLGLIPVVALSADDSAQAATISAQAFMRKPFDTNELVRIIERVLLEKQRHQLFLTLSEGERLASLGRLAAGVGHEINNPLAYSMLNVSEARTRVKALLGETEEPSYLDPTVIEKQEVNANLKEIAEMLGDCEGGLERIRTTVGNLQRLSRQGDEPSMGLDIEDIINQSASMAWNEIRHRARLIKRYAKVPLVQGRATGLGQVFLNLLINAAQAIPEGDAERNQIRISTAVESQRVVVEIADTGMGMTPEVLGRVFEPFFTTKNDGIGVGTGTGLGLAISCQTVIDHGGQIEVESEFGRGSVFRVLLPYGEAVVPSPPLRPARAFASQAPALRGRVLVIDDEPEMSHIIQVALSDAHEVVVVNRASQALARMAAGERFDVVLCDVVMPDINGPQIYAKIAERWPQMASALVFMTGGAFTPDTFDFIERVRARVLSKPFRIEELKKVVRDHVQGNA